MGQSGYVRLWIDSNLKQYKQSVGKVFAFPLTAVILRHPHIFIGPHGNGIPVACISNVPNWAVLVVLCPFSFLIPQSFLLTHLEWTASAQTSTLATTLIETPWWHGHFCLWAIVRILTHERYYVKVCKFAFLN